MSKTSVLHQSRTVTRSSVSNNKNKSPITSTKKATTAMKASNVVGVNNIHQLQPQKSATGAEQQRQLNGREVMMSRRLNNPVIVDKKASFSKGRTTTGNFSHGLLGKTIGQQVQNKRSLEVVEILSDSEDSNDQGVTFPHGAKNKKPSQRNIPTSSSESSSLTSKSTSDGTTTPPPNLVTDLDSYYRSKGLTLSHVRRLNKNYVRHDGPSSEARGIVFWDSFSPPPGFSMDDVPTSDSQGQSEPVEDVISPAILNAAKYKAKPRAIIKVSNSEAEYEEILRKLTKRKANNLNKENSPQKPKKKSTPENRGADLSCVNSPSFNSSFPDIADDLNDSLLIMCTQAAEQEYCTSADSDKNENPELNEANIKQKEKTEVQKAPLQASTPVHSAIKSSRSRLMNETPKSAKNRTWRSTESIISHSESASSLFETSGNNYEPRRRAALPMPRRSLFGSFEEVANDSSPKASGDFVDDDDDELFSQIKFPGEEGFGNGMNGKTERYLADQSTQIINQSDDSFFKHADIFTEIDKLEEMAINSGNNMNATGRTAAISLVDDVKRQHQPPSSSKQPGKPIRESPRTSTRRSKTREFYNRKH